jgi:hypothetical protein
MRRESGARTQSLRPRTPKKLPLLRPVIINEAILALQPPGNSTVFSLLVNWSLRSTSAEVWGLPEHGLPLIGLRMSVYQYIARCGTWED